MSRTDPPVRIARFIASRGLASRREAERWIADGRVSVNGAVITEPGTTVSGEDHVRLDGKALPKPPPKVYLLLYKPKGTITGRNDPHGRKSVLELVKHMDVRVEPVGRLDYDTEGALLLTNDGDLAHQLTHPSSQVPKRYIAKVWRTPDPRTLKRLAAGIPLEDGRAAPCKVRLTEGTDGGNAWIEITVTEGRNRLIRRMMQAVNHPVSKLRRESFATISIRGMERGDVRTLTKQEIARIHDLADGKKPARAGKSFLKKKGFAKAKPKKSRSGKKRLGSRGKGVK